MKELRIVRQLVRRVPNCWPRSKKTKTSEPVTSLCRSSVCRSSLRGTSALATTAYAQFHCSCLCGQNANTPHITLIDFDECHFLLNISRELVAWSTKIQCPLWPANRHHNYAMMPWIMVHLNSPGGTCWSSLALCLPERTSQPASRKCCLGMHLHRLYSTDLRTSPTAFKWNEVCKF